MTVIFPFCPSRQYTLSLFRFFSVLALLAASGFSHAAEFAGGTGDAGSPYEIATAEQLDAVRDHLDSHFELTADIDLGGNAWSAIGNYNASFTGVLDGNGHAITGLNINFNSNDTHKGLFGALRGAQIRNLRVLDAVITSSASTFVDRVGILSGQAREFSTVSNVFVSGAVQAANYVGGLIGTIEDSTLRDTGADVHVEGRSMVGGLIGANFNTVTIERSFALGNVDAVFSHIGGLVGEARTLEVHDSFARGAVTAGGSRVGGLLGWAENDVSVNNSYATGQVDAPDASDTPGGLIGNADGSGNTVEASYWDTVTSGQSSSDGGTGSDTGEMTDAGSITAPGIFSSWDFDATWGMDSNLNGGYPVLLWDVAAEATLDIQAPAGNLSEPALPQTFTWNTGTTSSLVSYDFQLARDAGFNDIVLEQSGLDTPSVDGPVLEKDTEYHWRVRAVVGDSIGQWQSTTFTTPAVVFAGGQGSSADPWQIASAEQLDLVRGYLSDHFVLTADIDLGGSNWESIGPQGTPFTGELDGAGHTISGLYINSGGTYQGLFGALSQATVTELTILDADITTSAIRAGVLAGQDENESTISHVYVSGQIEAAAASGVGGLVGGARRSTISNSGADVTVRGMSTGLGAVGGLVGFTESAQIQRSFALGNVEGGMQVGGLVGYVYGTVNPIFANIDESFARGDVTGSDRVGGLVGHFAEGIVRLSYASGLVNNSDSNGGLIGLDGGANNLGSSWDTDADSATFDSYDSAPWDIDPNVNDGYPYLLIPVSTPGNVALQSPANEATVTGADPAFVWDSAYNAAAYEVEIADNESFESALPRLDVADGETQIDMPASLESGTVYYWRVRAVNAGTVAGEWSSPNAFYTGELAPPTLTATTLDPDFVGGSAAVQLFSDAAATVRADQSLQSLTLTVSDLDATDDEWLVIDGSDVSLQDGNTVSTANTGLAVAVAVAGATATVSVTGASLDAAGMNALVDGIRYRHDGLITASGNRVVTLTGIQDDGGKAFGDEDTTALALSSSVSVAPSPPVLVGAGIPDLELSPPDATEDLSVHFSDPRDLDLTYSATGLPAEGITLSGDGVLTASSEAAGVYAVDVTATNTEGGSVSSQFTLTVTDPTAVYDVGDGSAGSPFEIATTEQLNALRSNLDSHFELTADIDLGASVWEPIGTEAQPFTGVLDGAGHEISGLTVNREIDAGLFGYVTDGEIRNLFLTNVDVTGEQRVGALAGALRNALVEDIWAAGQVGGTAAAPAAYIGGLVGRSRWGSTIQRSGTDVQISNGRLNAGGLVGTNMGEGTVIRQSFAIGDVTADSNVGGLVGENDGGAVIADSFAHGSVSASSAMAMTRAGGLIGFHNYYDASTDIVVRVERSYATGTVTGGSPLGGLIGSSYPETVIENSYWDTEASGESDSEWGQGYPTAEMQDRDTYAAWDLFEEGTGGIWDIDPAVNDGYPYLRIPVSMAGAAVLESPAAQAAVTGADPVFAWAAAHNADRYEVVVADNENFSPVLTILVVPGNDTQVDIPASLAAESVYYWRVRAINPGGIAGAWSSANAFYTGELAPPALSVSALDPDFVEGDAAVQLFDAAAATVRTGQLLQSLTLTVSGLGGAGDEWLVIDGSDVELQDGNSVSTADTGLTVAVAVAVAGATATVSVTGASLNSADMNALVNGIRYRNDGDIATSASREITLIELQDDGGTVFADENTTVLALASVISLSPPSAPVTPPASGSTIGGIVTGATLNGVSTILPGGGLNGGVINGTVNNEGEITGDVSLGASATINGGLVSGNISGQPSAPGRIVGATVSADAQLSHVVIGEGTVLEPGVELGAGVRFASVELIPEDTELAQTLPQLNWNGDDSVSVPDLNASVLASGERTLASLITDLPVFGEQLSEAGFDSQLGEFSLMLDDGRAALLPVSVQRHDGDEEVRVTADGHVLFASPDGLRIELVPVLVSAAKFASVLNEDIGLELASNGSVLVAREPGPSTDAGAAIQSMSAGDTPELSYVVRPGLLAVPAYRHDEPGLHFHAMPGLGNVQGMSQVFESVDGTLLEQDIIAAPADWDALSELLWQLGDDVRDVRINELGLITVEQDAGILRLRVELLVREGAEPAGDPMYYTFAGDLSGNGVADYWLIYPNGDRQAIFLYR